MKSIFKLIKVLAIVYFAAPFLRKPIYDFVKKNSLETLVKQRTPLTEIAQGLTGK
jgi:hypothetical protein